LSDVALYDKLRTNKGQPHRILIVLFLPPDAADWLNCSSDQLVLKKAAYWVCLYGAPRSNNSSGETIYLPKVNLLSPASIITLAHDVGKSKLPIYKLPTK
jgi:hypothetical protein